MIIDYNTLLIALASSGSAILAAALTSWTISRKGLYLALTAIGIGLVAAGLALMALSENQYDQTTLPVPFFLILAGISVVYAGARQYRHKKNIWLPAIALGSTSIVASITLIMFGLVGAGAMALDIGLTTMLLLSAGEYWNAKEDSHSVTIAIAGFYVLEAFSFLACAVAQLATGDFTAYPPTESLAEQVNALISMISVPGIGALTLALHFARAARLHQVEANTDSLTGVLNRRALFEHYAESEIVPGLFVLLFDLDHFKQINDHLGHAQGDATLQRFAEILLGHRREGDIVARIGGEEFCMVLRQQTGDEAKIEAERIRGSFAGLAIPGGRDGAVATVSVGVASGGRDETFSSVLSRADDALYKAKHDGRNRVHQADPRLVAA